MDLSSSSNRKSNPKPISSILDELGLDKLDKLKLPEPTTEDIELQKKLEREREFKKQQKLLITDLRLAKCPKKHVSQIETMQSGDIPSLFHEIRKNMKGESLLLCGHPKGKTLSACCWLANQYRKNKSIFYISGFDLCCELTSFQTRNSSKVVYRSRKTSCLVIDDVQNINNSDLNFSSLANLISIRSDNEKKTILVSSLLPSENDTVRRLSRIVDDILAI